MNRLRVQKLIYGTTELNEQIEVIGACFFGNILIVLGYVLENIVGV